MAAESVDMALESQAFLEDVTTNEEDFLEDLLQSAEETALEAELSSLDDSLVDDMMEEESLSDDGEDPVQEMEIEGDESDDLPEPDPEIFATVEVVEEAFEVGDSSFSEDPDVGIDSDSDILDDAEFDESQGETQTDQLFDDTVSNGLEEHEVVDDWDTFLDESGDVEEALDDATFEDWTDSDLVDIIEIVEEDFLEDFSDLEDFFEEEVNNDLLELDTEEESFEELIDLDIDDLQAIEEEGIEEFEDLEELIEDPGEEVTEDAIEEIADESELDTFDDWTEELQDSADLEDSVVQDLEEEIDERDDLSGSEEHQVETLDEYSDISDLLSTETLKNEIISDFSDASNTSDYQSVFSPQEQFVAHYAAEMFLLEAIQAKSEHADEVTSISQDNEFLPSSLYSVSFDEALLPPISLEHFGQELSSLEGELARLESPRAFQDFHEQLHHSTAEPLDIDTYFSLPNLTEEREMVSQGPTLPEAPPYDFFAELESFEDDEDLHIRQQLQNPLYPYSVRRVKQSSERKTFQKPTTDSTTEAVPRATSKALKTSNSKPQSLDKFIHSQNTEQKLIEHVKQSIRPSQKNLPLFSSDMKFSSSREIVEQQIEALNKLKSLKYKIDPTNNSTRIITLTASSEKEMGEIFLEKLGNFSYPTYVMKNGKRSLVKLKRGIWKPMDLFIDHRKLEKEIQNTNGNQTDWVVYNKPKGWKYTGNQRTITKVKMDLFNVYHTRLEEQARSLAADNKRTRFYLSKFEKNSIDYQNRLNFWVQYGYQFSQKDVNPEVEKEILNEKEKIDSRLHDNLAINDFITNFNASMQNLMDANAAIPLGVYETLEKAKTDFPYFIPVIRYEDIYFFMENYNDLIYTLKPWEQITSTKGGTYTTVFHAIEAIKDRTYVLKNHFNDKTYRTMKEDVPRVTNKRGFHNMYRKLKDESLRSQLMKHNNFSPQQANKTIWEEIYPLTDVEYVLRAYLNEQNRMNRISPYLKTHIRKEISDFLEGFTSITNFPPSSTYIIKVFDTEILSDNMISNNKGLVNADIINSDKIKEFIMIIDQISQEISSINLSEIAGATFNGDRIISISGPNELISNGKILKAYFESCADAHINAIPRYVFQSPKWVSRLGLPPDQVYTAYNTGNTANFDQDKIAASGRQDFTIIDENKVTHAIAQNKLLRIDSGRLSYLAEVSRDLIATQGFGVPGYNIFTLLNHDADVLGITSSTVGANITYIGVIGGVNNPSTGIPKLGQVSEWAMYKANNGKRQVTSGSNLTKNVKLKTLIDEAKIGQYRSSKRTIIPSNDRLDKDLIKKIHLFINSTTSPLKFLFKVLNLSTELKKDNDYSTDSIKRKK
jgi:hypothetical protein